MRSHRPRKGRKFRRNRSMLSRAKFAGQYGLSQLKTATRLAKSAASAERADELFRTVVDVQVAGREQELARINRPVEVQFKELQAHKAALRFLQTAEVVDAERETVLLSEEECHSVGQL